MSDVIEMCQKLINYQSVNSNVAEAFNFLREYLQQCGFVAQIITYTGKNNQKVPNLCASYGNGEPHLLFVGHADVVTQGDEKQWKYPPFIGKIVNDTLYGRGIADMKGAIACFIKACEDIIAYGKLNGKITLVISGDEEEPIVEGTKKVLQKLHEKGERFDFAIVGEPSNQKEMGDEIKIGRRGDIVVHLTSFGTQGHTAYANKESNPVHNLINLLYKLQNDELDNGNDYFLPSVVQVTTFDVGNEASNVVANAARATVDIRFNSDYTLDDIENWVKECIKNSQGKFDVKFEYIGEAFLSSVNNQIINLQKIVEKYAGKKPTFSTSGGTSDARFVRLYCPVVEYGLTNQTIHKVNECEKLENIEVLRKIYKEFLESFFNLK